MDKKEDDVNKIVIWALIALGINYAILFGTAIGFEQFARLFLLITIATVLSVFGACMLAPKKSKQSFLAPIYTLLINALLVGIGLFTCGFKECFQLAEIGTGALVITAFVIYAPVPILISLIYALVEVKYDYFKNLAIRYKTLFFILLGIGIFIGITAVFARMPLEFGFGFLTALLMLCFITIFSFYFMYKFNLE